jgi:hypothetical protein
LKEWDSDMTIQAIRSVDNAARPAAISATGPFTSLMGLVINMDQDDRIIAIATVLASVVVAMVLR